MNRLSSLAAVAAVALLTAPNVAAQSLLATWAFESSNPSVLSGGELVATAAATSFTAIGGVTGSQSTQSVYSGNSCYSTSNYPLTFTGNATAGFQVAVDMTAWVPTTISMWLRASSSSARSRVVQYRTSQSGPWIEVAFLNSSVANNYERFVVALPSVAADPALADAAEFAFRVVAVFDPIAVNGYWREWYSMT